MYAMLKPGGTLGVVDHRLPEEADDARQLTSGYVKVSTVRRLAEAAGFQLCRSERDQCQSQGHQGLCRRRLDTAAVACSSATRTAQKYLAIGESDRMTLKFVKPN